MTPEQWLRVVPETAAETAPEAVPQAVAEASPSAVVRGSSPKAPLRPLGPARRLGGLAAGVRGPLLGEAARLEREGSRVLRLDTADPVAFGFEAPAAVSEDIRRAVGRIHGYGDPRGLPAARRAVVQHYETRGVEGLGIDDVHLGNGVSDLAQTALQALLDDGDEVLLPLPAHPLWTAAVVLAGGRPVHYICDEAAGWFPDPGDLEARITGRTRAVVVINPNNPTGAVYDEELLRGISEIAGRHGLVLLADEIHDKILYEGARHVPLAAVAPDVLCLTFNGLSKAYRACGYRSGWMTVTGPKRHAAGYLEGMAALAALRPCANVPAQHAVATALGGRQPVSDLVLPGGRLREQRDLAWSLLNDLHGVSCVRPMGALYAFPRLDRAVHPVDDDERMLLALLRQERILLVPGTAFRLPNPDHFRIVTLPDTETLTDAIVRIGAFLAEYRH